MVRHYNALNLRVDQNKNLKLKGRTVAHCNQQLNFLGNYFCTKFIPVGRRKSRSKVALLSWENIYVFNSVILFVFSMQKVAAACGTIHLDKANQNYTISVGSYAQNSNLECQIANTISSARVHELPLLCHRCPMVAGGMTYTVFLTGRSENKQFSRIKQVQVSTR